MTSQIRGVVFDLDNTLIKSRQGSLCALRTVSVIIAQHLRNNGHPRSRAELLRRLRQIERDRRAPDSGLVPRALYDRDVWWKTLLKELGLAKLQGPWIHRATLRYWDAYMGASPPFRDAEPTLRRLKRAGIRLAIVSDSDGTPGIKKLRVGRLPFRSLFDTVVVAGEDTPKVKPSSAPFLLVAKRLGLPPEECAYVGDNPSTDIEGAKAAGLVTILVRRLQYMVLAGVRPGRPTYEVRSLREIPGLLLSNRPSQRREQPVSQRQPALTMGRLSV